MQFVGTVLYSRLAMEYNLFRFEIIGNQLFKLRCNAFVVMATGDKLSTIKAFAIIQQYLSSK
jgi:hypothetical protein